MSAAQRYTRFRLDFEALERIAILEDQVELDSDRLGLMQNPTKEYASQMYLSGIELWFREHGILAGSEEIAARHHVTEEQNER